MRLDAVNLPGRFLAAGAALRRPAEPDHRLPHSAVGRKEITDASALVSLCVYDRWVQPSSWSHLSV
jgi:hypothetical protein